MKTASEIKFFLKENVSRILNIEMDRIREDVPLNTHYGLDSMNYLTIGAMLEDWLDLELTADFFFTYTTINELAEKLAE